MAATSIDNFTSTRKYCGFCYNPLWRLVLLLLFAARSHAALADGKVSFNNQIQPILSENCYPCHGPDSSSRKPKKHPLRLDRESFAFEPRDDGKPVIIKGDPGASEMVRRIKAKDDDMMPPASEHKTLKAEEIAVIEKWIAQGAKYEKHWSLIPPSRPALPEEGAGWAANPIDNFVARKLSQNGLQPNPGEQKARLYRRLHFDLTGLPPSPEELRSFLRDKSPKAFEREVDRMLAGDASAEHFARLWLDAVRYADTQGIHHDHMRSIWPYRDWVISAFKANTPFDQFTIDQIAGDMLPGATLDQKIASGYNRLLPTTGEGGAIAEEYAAVYAKDRVDTMTAVWLGLTMGCATCHDHKFDPITSKDFYSMTAFFRNNTSPILDNPRDANVAPLVFAPRREDLPQWNSLEQSIAKTMASIAERKRAARPDFDRWLAAAQKKPLQVSLDVKPALYLPLTEAAGPFRGVAQGEKVEWTGGQERRSGPFGHAPLLALGEPLEKAAPTFARTGQASYVGFIYVEGAPDGAVFSRMNRADGYRGWDLFLSDGKPTVHIVDQYPDAALKVTAVDALKPGRWHHVMAVFDGTREGADAIALYVDGIKENVEVNVNNLGTNIVARVPFRLGGRSDHQNAADMLNSGKVFLQDLRFYDKALTAVEIARLASGGMVRAWLASRNDKDAGAQTNALFRLFLMGFDKPSQRLDAELAQLDSEEKPLRQRGGTTLVMEEKKDSEPVANILIRGNYASKGAQVSAATPPALPPMEPDMPHNRLGLARWLVSKENPLVARVTVNRLWSQIFGLGIVETTEDFGVMGARPTDQDLLDWLAVEFMDSGWDFRHMVKTMVMSATYRQSEDVSPEKLEKDPLNKLYSRGPHIRLDAEEIRDQALAASGLLVPTVGGPPVKPYQPEGVWETVAMADSNTRFYKQDTGPSLYRRSMYTFWKRVAPPPNMEILNAPTRETFCTRRERTDTPLQALVTMNDPQFVEAARALAERAVESGKDFDARLDDITLPLLARRLTADERSVVRQLQQHALQEFQQNPKDAASLIAVGESKPGRKYVPAELAAWTLAASEIMNLDESLTK
jgi:hypothetical protein